ncbi:hypothetical protein TNCV_5001241 [Trichonephila clavipes]|nr:hypothetical protein TNCV_5001241 [Trichonephila clavipes]
MDNSEIWYGPMMGSHFDVVLQLARFYEPQSNAGGSIATGRISQAGLVGEEAPDEEDSKEVQPFGVLAVAHTGIF